jgi:hypothetical protein
MNRAIRVLVLLLLCFSIATPAKRTTSSRRGPMKTKSFKVKKVAKIKIKSHRRSSLKKSHPRKKNATLGHLSPAPVNSAQQDRSS